MLKTDYYVLLAVLIFVVLFTLATKGCDRTVAWQEELQLSTGETIMINREVVLKPGSGLPPYVGPFVNEYRIRFRYPPGTGPLIEWDLPRWGTLNYLEYDEDPLVLDLNPDKVWFIYTARSAGHGCIRYVKYQFQEGTWIETPLPDGLIEVHPTNLFSAGDPRDVKEGGMVSLSEKKAQLRSGGPNPAYFERQVGPQQIVPIYKEGLICVWDPVYQIFNATKHLD